MKRILFLTLALLLVLTGCGKTEPEPAAAQPSEPAPITTTTTTTTTAPEPVKAEPKTETPVKTEPPAVTPEPYETAVNFEGTWAGAIWQNEDDGEWYTLELVSFGGNLYGSAYIAPAGDPVEDLQGYTFCGLELIPEQPADLRDGEWDYMRLKTLCFSVMSNFGKYWGPAQDCSLAMTDVGLVFQTDEWNSLPLLDGHTMTMEPSDRVASEFPYRRGLPFPLPHEAPPAELFGLWHEENGSLFVELTESGEEGYEHFALYQKVPGAEVRLGLGSFTWQDGQMEGIYSLLGMCGNPADLSAAVTLDGDTLILTPADELISHEGGEPIRLKRASADDIPLVCADKAAAAPAGRPRLVEEGPGWKEAYERRLELLRQATEEKWIEERIYYELGYTALSDYGWPEDDGDGTLRYAYHTFDPDYAPVLLILWRGRLAEIMGSDGNWCSVMIDRQPDSTLTLYKDGMILLVEGGAGTLTETWYRIDLAHGEAVPVAGHEQTSSAGGTSDSYYLYGSARRQAEAEAYYADNGCYPNWAWNRAEDVSKATFDSFGSQSGPLPLPEGEPLVSQ